MSFYSFKTTLKKGVKYLVIFGLPFVVAQFIQLFPGIADMSLIDVIKALIPDQYEVLTVGAALVMLVNFLKVKVGLRLP